MVNAAVAALGLVLLAGGLALTGVISVIEEWVVVILPGTPQCETDYLGSLGLYTATFDPACTPASSSVRLAGPKKVESSTTEFWALFPTQTGFNGFFGEDLAPFTTCEAAFTSAEAKTALRTAAGPSVVKVANAIVAGLAAEQATLEAGIDETFTKVDGLVAQTWSNLILSKGNELMTGVQTSTTGMATAIASAELVVNGALTGVNGGTPLALSYATVGAALTTSDPAEAAKLAQLGPAGAGVLQTNAAPANLVALLLDLNIAGVVANVPAEQQAALTLGLTGVQGALGFYNSVCDAQTDFAACFNVFTSYAGISGVSAVVFADILPVLSWLQQVPSSSQADLQAGAGLVVGCQTFRTGVTSFGTCAATYSTGVEEDMTGYTFICEALLGAGFGIAPPTGFVPQTQDNDCNWYYTLDQLPKIPSVDLTSDPELAKGVDALLEELEECAGVPVNKTDCKANMHSPGGRKSTPELYDGPEYSLCLGLRLRNLTTAAECNDFTDFVNVALSLDPETSVGTMKLVIDACVQIPKLVSGNVLAPAVNDHTACLGQLSSAGTFIPGLESSGNVAGLALIDSAYHGLIRQVFLTGDAKPEDEGDVVKTLIRLCEEDEEDARRIGLAQVMIPAAMGAEGVALVLAVVAIALNKAPLAFISAVLAVAGTGLTLASLLLVRGAPVYQAVGGEEVTGTPYYQAGLAETLGMIAILLPAVGGITIAVSGCLNKPEDEGQLTGKVETY